MRKKLSNGVSVTGFEYTVTTTMLERHFDIKPILGIKHSTDKHSNSKGCAYIYYGS